MAATESEKPTLRRRREEGRSDQDRGFLQLSRQGLHGRKEEVVAHRWWPGEGRCGCLGRHFHLRQALWCKKKLRVVRARAQSRHSTRVRRSSKNSKNSRSNISVVGVVHQIY